MHLFPISLSLPLAPGLIHHLSPSASFTHSNLSPPLFIHYSHQLSAISPSVVQTRFSPAVNLYHLVDFIFFTIQVSLSLSVCHASCSISFIIQVGPFSVSFCSPLYSCFSCHQEHCLPLFFIPLNE